MRLLQKNVAQKSKKNLMKIRLKNNTCISDLRNENIKNISNK